MKTKQMRTVLLAAAVACSIGIVGCGSTGSISSLTDNDSTAALTEDTAAVEQTATAAGTVTTAGNESTENQGQAVLPEIQAQTIETEPAADNAGAAEAEATTEQANDTAAADTAEPQAEAESTEAAAQDDEAAALPAASADAAGAEEDNEPVYENDEDAEAVAAADAIDVAETDEGGAHGEGNTATVIADDVNVRSYPEVDEDDDNVLGTLSYGDVVTVLGNEEGWYKIEFEGQTGYANANFFE